MTTTLTHPFGTLPTKDLLSISQLGAGDLGTIFDTAAALKADRNAYSELLHGKRLGMIFEKESLRTRFTFDVGMQDLGGSAVFMDHGHVRLGTRESIKDMAKNLERWVHGIVARTYKHKALEELAANCSIPVINGLSDFVHPCQALADFFTLTERWGDVRGRKITYVGDGNNTCHSLLHVATRLGAHITVSCPEGYEPNARVVHEAMLVARETGSDVRIQNDPEAGARDADAIYTDVWASMGQEDETEERAAIFNDFRVDEEMMALAKPGAVFMHCLPAHRGQEVTSGVIDSPASIVFDIAENRLHVQKAVLALLLGEGLIGSSMFQSIDDFESSWVFESQQTSKVLANLTDATLEQRTEPEGRTLGALAWHLVTTIPEMLQQAGLAVNGPGKDIPPPRNVRAIAHEYGRLSLSIPGSVRAKWHDGMLGGTIPMYGQQWQRRQVLSSLILHQAHHRGQMTVLMRQAGLKVPGIYGPSREEWVALGHPALP